MIERIGATTVQSRMTALQGEYVRLYCTFEKDGVLTDPWPQPSVRITTNSYVTESSSSSSETSTSTTSGAGTSSSLTPSSKSSSSDHGHSGWGPFPASIEHKGIWYVDWAVPLWLPPGDYFDIWTFRWTSDSRVEHLVLRFTVHPRDTFINFKAENLAEIYTDVGVDMMMALTNNMVYEVQNIPIYWEQGYRTSEPNKLNFAFGNWNSDPYPQVMKNQRIMRTGWTPDMDGHVMLANDIEEGDQFYARYSFAYFSNEELLSFLNEGLWAMNATPPSSLSYSGIQGMPFEWRFGVVLWASIVGLRRLIMGTTVQERALIWGEDPARAESAANRYHQLYSDYQTIWMEVRKDIKTNRLPGITAVITPEYTLPGGRSRWFRYLYK